MSCTSETSQTTAVYGSDFPDTEPQNVLEDFKAEENKPAIVGRKKCHRNHRKHQYSDDEDDDNEESSLPSHKKQKMSVIKPVRKFVNKIGKYAHEFIRDVTDGAEELFDTITPPPTSRKLLQECEEWILKDTKGKVQDVVVEENDGNNVTIHTILYEATAESKPAKIPIVLIHGYGGGIACFHQNFGSLHQERKVYAIDIPGFALSTRVKFSDEPRECIDRIVGLIENWRAAMSIEKFILLGHSFGGYLAGSYASQFKEHVRHLILAESWGVLSKQEDEEKIKLVHKIILEFDLTPYSIMAKYNNTGRILYDVIFPKKVKEIYGEKMVEYFYHCNAQPDATGEKAFRTLSDKYRWPHIPLRESLEKLNSSVPITFLYGAASRFNNGGGKIIQKKRKNVFLPAPLDAGHHIQVEDHQEFNKRVNEVCKMVDNGTDQE